LVKAKHGRKWLAVAMRRQEIGGNIVARFRLEFDAMSCEA
jgi:hypothetical protein